MIKKCAVINDISGFGKCSLTAAVPVMAAMKVQALPVVTSVLSHQTAFDDYRIIDTSGFIDEVIDGWKKNRVVLDGILTGFIANDEQIHMINRFIDAFRNDENILVVDPVMGDDGEVYKNYTENMIEGVRSLAGRADVITPNAMELCILAGKDFTSDENLLYEYAKTLLSDTLKDIVVTGIKKDDEIITLCVNEDGSVRIRGNYIRGSYSGTGDILASVVTAGILKGKKVAECASIAHEFIEKSILDTDYPDTREGVCFEKHLDMLYENF